MDLQQIQRRDQTSNRSAILEDSEIVKESLIARWSSHRPGPLVASSLRTTPSLSEVTTHR